jgi:hypothetical protein
VRQAPEATRSIGVRLMSFSRESRKISFVPRRRLCARVHIDGVTIAVPLVAAVLAGGIHVAASATASRGDR